MKIIRKRMYSIKKHFRLLLVLSLILTLIMQLPISDIAAAPDESPLQSEIYETAYFRFRIASDWEIEEDDPEAVTKHTIFHAEGGFDIHALEVPNRVDPYVVDGFQANICTLCGIPCPSGDELKSNLYSFSGFSDEAALFDIYDEQNYVKGGIFSDESNTLIIAADCSALTAEHDAALSRLLVTVQPADLERTAGSGSLWEGIIESEQEAEPEQEELAAETDPGQEEEPVLVDLIILSGAHVPSDLMDGDVLDLDPGKAAEDTPVHLHAVSILKSSDDGAGDPYMQTVDTTAEAGMYYSGQIVLEAESGYAFTEDTEVQLISDPEDSASVIPFDGKFVNEDGLLVIEFWFGQAEEIQQPEPTDLGRIDIAVPEAEYGKAPVKPEDREITIDDRAAYRLAFGEWTGNFDEAGSFKENETYMLPLTVTAETNWFIGPDTEIYVNGVCLFASGSVDELDQAELYFPSATGTQPGSYWITLVNEHASMKSSDVEWLPVTESTAGREILISVYPDPGYTVDSIQVCFTNNPQETIPAELLNRQGSSAVFGFTMPEGAVTVRANLIDPPPAQIPEAVFIVTGPASGVLTNVDGSMKWSLDGMTYMPVLEGTVSIPEISAGMLYVIRSGDGVNTTDSEPQLIPVLQQEAPEGLMTVACRTEKNSDGIIYGLSAGMEWRASGEEEFTEIAEGETKLAGLAAGTYELRYRFTEAMLASDTVSVQVDVYDSSAYHALTVIDASAFVAEDVEIHQARKDDIITIRAEESRNSAFDSWVIWTVNGELISPEDPKSAETTFVMPSDTVFILARFADEIDLGYGYSVQYDGNGADAGSMEYQILYEKEEQQLKLNAFTREGFIFAGWSESPEAEKAEYEDGQRITAPLAGSAGQHCVLYAVWQTPPPPEYKILVGSGTACVDGEAVVTAPEGAEVTIKAEEKAGKVFVKWLDNDHVITDPEKAETSFIMPASDIVVMAQYMNSQSVTYKVDDAFVLHILKVPYSVSPYALQVYDTELCALCGVDVPSESSLKAGIYNTRAASDAGFFFIFNEQNYIKGGIFTDGTSILYVAADCSELTAARDAAFHRILAAYQRSSLAWDQEYESKNPMEITSIEITIPDAAYGEVPERPEDYLGIREDEAAYVVTFDDWTGSFDEEGRCQAGEVYTLPVTIAVLPGCILNPETQIFVNDVLVPAVDDFSTEGLAYLEYTAEMPQRYPISLLEENASLQSYLKEEEETDSIEITEAFPGQEVLIRVDPNPGYMAAAIYFLKTEDRTVVEIPAELLEREGNSALFSFEMPEYSVSVGAKLAGLPKAEMPEAEYTVTGETTGTLSHVDTTMKWSQDGIIYIPITNDPEQLTGIRSKVLYIIRTGDGITTTDSDPQKIYID